jgi:hypothetical protein
MSSNDSSVMFHKERSDNPNKFIMHTSRVICFVAASRFITSETFLTVERRKGERGRRGRPANRHQHGQA